MAKNQSSLSNNLFPQRHADVDLLISSDDIVVRNGGWFSMNLDIPTHLAILKSSGWTTSVAISCDNGRDKKQTTNYRTPALLIPRHSTGQMVGVPHNN